MLSIEWIKSAVRNLYETNPQIHISVHSTKPKLNVVLVPAIITGVYKNLFTIEVVENGLKKVYTIQYTDIFIGKTKIQEISSV